MKPFRALWFLLTLLAPALDATVVLLEPQAGVNHPASTVPLFRWEPVATATEYTLTVCHATGCAGAGQVLQVTITETSHAAPLGPGAYEFYVEARNGGALLGTSEHRGFWVDDFCLTSVVVADVDGDGRTDRVCSAAGQTRVSRATTDGFEEPSVWLSQTLTTPFAADFDGDGRSDLGAYETSTGTFSVALSTGTAFAAPVSWGVASVSGYSCSAGSAATGTGDFDGNGKTDVFCKLPTRDEVLVGLSTGTGFTYSLFGSAVCDTAERVGTMELDGDGKSDWYCVGVTNGLFRVFRSTGSSFQSGITAADGAFCGDPYHVLADLNGDGRTDLTCSSNGRVRLSTGAGFVDQGSAFGGWCTATGASVFAADVDGDGVAELVCNQPQAGTDDIQVREWDGTQLTGAQTWLASFCPGNVTSGDFNGDGKADMLCDGVEAALGGTPGWRADLMSSAQTSLGGVVSLEYGFSTEFQNEPGVGTQVLLTSLTTDDGRGGTATTTYTYSGGATNREARRFLGYETIRQDLPCIAGETQCPWIETQFRQDLPAVGRPSRVERRAGNGALLAATDYSYTTVDTASLRSALRTEVTAYEFDGSGTACGAWPCASGKRTRTASTYDAYGNVTQTVAYGDVDASGDEVTTAHTYVHATTPYIVRALAQSETFAGVGTGGTRLSARRALYDGSSNWQAVPSAGVLTSTADWLDTEDRYLVTQIARDAHGNATSQTDATNRTVSMAYDGDSLFPVSTTNAANETTSTAWHQLCGTPAQSTGEANQVTSYTYDALCRPTRADGPSGSFTTWEYLNFGDPSAQRTVTSIPSATDGDGTGDQWSAEYVDGLGRTYKTMAKGPTPAASIVTERDFDARGSLASATQPRFAGDTAYTTTFSYDALGRTTAVEHSDGEVVTTSYGLRSRTTQDELGRPTTLRFDAYGRQVQQERQLSGSPVYTDSVYDLLGRMTGMEDAAGNGWSWTFDSLGRTLVKDDPDSGVWTYAYDDAGRQTSQTDAKGQVTTFAYDPVGRLSTKAWQSSPPQTTTYTYSQARSGYFNTGQLTEVASPVDVLRLDYDAPGQLARQQRVFEGITYSLERRYDAAGRLTGLTYPDADTVGTPSDPIQYDAAGRLQSVPGFVSNFDWDASGRMIFQVNLNGTVTTRTFDAERGHLTRILTTGPGGTLQDLQYAHDETGRITAVSSPFATESWSYGYDDLGRLTQADNVSDALESQSFQYDAVGSMTYNSRVGTYVYPSPSQPRPHAPTTINGGSMTYDPNGNLLTGRGRTYTWDWENLPTQIGTTQFVYGADRSRLKKLDSGNAVLYPLGHDYEISGGTATKYLNMPGAPVLGKRVGATPFWTHADNLGSGVLVTDAAGAEALRRIHRPFGGILSATGPGLDSRDYLSQRTDPETNLTYLTARYFDPEIGLFATADPAQADPSAFGYAGGDPINWSDPTGLSRSQGPDGSELCSRYPWACSAAQMGAGLGGMGGPGPGSMSSAELMDAYGALPPVLTGPDSYLYPSANPLMDARHKLLAGEAAAVYDPITGIIVNLELGDSLQVAGGTPEDLAKWGSEASVAGKVNNAANTAIGAAAGLLTYKALSCASDPRNCSPFGVDATFFALASANVRINNNAIEFMEIPWMPTAITLGNSILYARADQYFNPAAIYGAHEYQHTLQGEALGVFYLPLHIDAGLTSLWRCGSWHCGNWLEQGPDKSPRRAWPW